MMIQSVQVQNFCSLQDAKIQINDITALIGPNGAGKSSFLKALNLFYEQNASYTEDDFYDRNTSKNIIVSVTFTDLGEQAKDRFRPYISDDTLTVEKVMEYPGNKADQQYYGYRPINPDFKSFRSASGQDLRREYENLREEGYGELPEYQNKNDAEKDLRNWEISHPDECTRKRDDGQFFGFGTTGDGSLEEFTQFISIPAVRDAGEETDEGRNSAMGELMDLVVRATLSDRGDLEKLRKETHQEYREIIEDAADSELRHLEGSLSDTLDTFAPGVDIDLSWDTQGTIDIQLPSAEIRLREDEFASSVEHAGHGSQRAFIISLLQNLAILGEKEGDENEGIEPSLILGIEEPELYQHPNRQRHLMSILSSFEEQEVSGVASSVQVVYTTHSPLMVQMERFDDIRALKKTRATEGRAKVTEVQKSSLEEVARELEQVTETEHGTFTSESTRARLEPVMTPWMNEGFFSDVVVLVEGLEDRSALLGRARTRGIDFNAKGVTVLPCNGKTNLDRPFIIFSNLGKDVYLIFDSDSNSDDDRHIRINQQLLRLVDGENEDYPHGVFENHACFETTLADTLQSNLGDEFYAEALESACDTYGYNSENSGLKNPAIMDNVFTQAEEEDRDCENIDKIIDQITSF